MADPVLDLESIGDVVALTWSGLSHKIVRVFTWRRRLRRDLAGRDELLKANPDRRFWRKRCPCLWASRRRA